MPEVGAGVGLPCKWLNMVLVPWRGLDLNGKTLIGFVRLPQNELGRVDDAKAPGERGELGGGVRRLRKPTKR